jgi:hypothetical protein
VRVNFEDFIDASGLEKIRLYTTYREGGRLVRKSALGEGLMGDSQQAQVIRPPALAPPQIGCVINNAGEVCVFEVNPDRKPVAIARKSPGETGPK